MSDELLKKIIAKIDTSDTKIEKLSDALDSKIDSLSQRVDSKVDKLSERVDSLTTTVDTLAKITNKLVMKVIDIDSKMGNMATKDDLLDTENRMITHIDGFVKLHETLDVEMVSLRNKYDRLEQRMNR